MAKQGIESKDQGAQARQLVTQEITPDQWIAFFAQFTRENRGAHARLEVLGAEVGYQVETEDRPFDGISTDVKDGERTVWISFGSTPDDHLTHGVHQVTVVRVLPPIGEAGAVVEAVSKDGTRTVLELSRPEAYALPPATAQEVHS
jgi:hypothetical protein